MLIPEHKVSCQCTLLTFLLYASVFTTQNYPLWQDLCESAEFRGSPAIIGLLGLLPSCHHAFVGIS